LDHNTHRPLPRIRPPPLRLLAPLRGPLHEVEEVSPGSTRPSRTAKTSVYPPPTLHQGGPPAASPSTRPHRPIRLPCSK
jgi:hypothetical protein